MVPLPLCPVNNSGRSTTFYVSRCTVLVGYFWYFHFSFLNALLHITYSSQLVFIPWLSAPAYPNSGTNFMQRTIGDRSFSEWFYCCTKWDENQERSDSFLIHFICLGTKCCYQCGAEFFFFNFWNFGFKYRSGYRLSCLIPCVHFLVPPGKFRGNLLS